MGQEWFPWGAEQLWGRGGLRTLPCSPLRETCSAFHPGHLQPLGKACAAEEQPILCHHTGLLEFISLCTPGTPSSHPTYFYSVHTEVAAVKGAPNREQSKILITAQPLLITGVTVVSVLQVLDACPQGMHKNWKPRAECFIPHTSESGCWFCSQNRKSRRDLGKEGDFQSAGSLWLGRALGWVQSGERLRLSLQHHSCSGLSPGTATAREVLSRDSRFELCSTACPRAGNEPWPNKRGKRGGCGEQEL